MGLGDVQTTWPIRPSHPALVDYASIDALVRPALGLPPHDGTPDAFALALAVGLLFQRFVNACSAAHVDSTEPWMHALAFADGVLPTSFQEPHCLRDAHLSTPTPSVELTLGDDKLEDTPGPPPQPAYLSAGPINPVSSVEPEIPRADSIRKPGPTIGNDLRRSHPPHQSPTRHPPKESTLPTRGAAEAGPSKAPLSLEKLRPHIRAILVAPDVDFETLSITDVRRQLVERGIPGVTDEWAHENKSRIRLVIREEYKAASAAQIQHGEQPKMSSPRTHDQLLTPRSRHSVPEGVKLESQKKKRKASAAILTVSTSAVPLATKTSPPCGTLRHSPASSTALHDTARAHLAGRVPQDLKPFALSAGRTTHSQSNSSSAAGPSSDTGRRAIPKPIGDAHDSPLAIKLSIPPPAPRRDPENLPPTLRAQAASATPVAASAGKKRPRSATPDSEEDEFAASFMRKRKVSASLV